MPTGASWVVLLLQNQAFVDMGPEKNYLCRFWRDCPVPSSVLVIFFSQSLTTAPGSITEYHVPTWMQGVDENEPLAIFYTLQPWKWHNVIAFNPLPANNFVRMLSAVAAIQAEPHICRHNPMWSRFFFSSATQAKMTNAMNPFVASDGKHLRGTTL